MTRPANFPGRVNARRIRALQRLRPDSWGAEDEHRALTSRIIEPVVARGVRTKKDHSHMAKIRGQR